MSDALLTSLIDPASSIRDAMVRIGRSRYHILLVVDAERRLLGTVTDGDIRRSILQAVSLEAPVTEIMNRSPHSVPQGTAWAVARRLMRDKGIFSLPQLDGAGRVVGMIGAEDFGQPDADAKPHWVVLMAGGLGSRLRPLTDDTPKPLLPVGGRPILETILHQLLSHGFSHFYISVNYKAEAVKAHFGDGSRLGAEIRYLEEDSALGTAGPLALIDERPDMPLLVMNGDLLTKLNFSALFQYHREHAARATVCVREFDMQVPYGVVEFDNNRVLGISEKPVHRFMVNAGIYVLDPTVLDRIPRGQRLDMPDLLRSLTGAGEAVFGYPIHEYWIDIGRLEDFHRAANEFSLIFPQGPAGGTADPTWP